MQELLDRMKDRARTTAITAAGVLLILQIVVPSLFDVVFGALIFGCGYFAGKYGDRR